MNFYLKVFAVLLGLAFCVFQSCGSGEQHSVTSQSTVPIVEFNFTKLEGEWQLRDGNNTTTETWQRNGENKWKASSQTIDSTGQVIFSESVLLEVRSGQWQYCVTAMGQNDNKEVCFSLVKNSERKLVFENKAHDFPQSITYEMISDDKLLAYIEGPNGKGGNTKVDFRFNKR